MIMRRSGARLKTLPSRQREQRSLTTRELASLATRAKAQFSGSLVVSERLERQYQSQAGIVPADTGCTGNYVMTAGGAAAKRGFPGSSFRTVICTAGRQDTTV